MQNDELQCIIIAIVLSCANGIMHSKIENRLIFVATQVKETFLLGRMVKVATTHLFSISYGNAQIKT